MSIEDIRNAFMVAAKGLLRPKDVLLKYNDQGRQYLALTGWHNDGTPYAVASAPFDGDPGQRAAEIAQKLVRVHMTDAGPNLTGTSHLSLTAKSLVGAAKDRIAKIKERLAQANAAHAAASDKLEGVCAAYEQEAADLEATVKELLPGANSLG